MAGLLDYYKENPELWAENESLVAKDPAYNLGMMDLDAMSFNERGGGEYSPQYKGASKKLYDWFGWGDKPEYEPRSRTLGAYLYPDAWGSKWDEEMGLEPGKIGLYTGPFTKGDTPTYWTDPNLVPPDERTSEPLFNVDKARVVAHENRHRLMYENPELYETQPTWPGIEEGMSFKPGTFSKMGNEFWRNEAFNRFQDLQNFPELRFRGDSEAAEWYPAGLSAVDLKPQDMYFDKIWRDKWKPYAKRFNEKLKEISKRERRNVPGTPIVPMGVGRGRDEPSGADLSPGGGYGQSPTGSDIAGTPFSRGGILGAF